MRCPKCGYISFDHNQICPKCNKDISDEQARLNLPTYKNNPPALLGMLVGAGDESNVGFTLDSNTVLSNRSNDIDFEDSSSIMGEHDIDFGEDEQDLEISLTDDSEGFEIPGAGINALSGDMSGSREGEEISLDMDEISFEDGTDTADELELDLDDVSRAKRDRAGEDPVIDLDGISPNDSFVLEGVPDFIPEAAEETIEIDSLSREDAGVPDKGRSTIELNVSDLKINETGELEINSIPDEIVSPRGLPEEDEISIDKIDISSDEEIELDFISEEEEDDKNNTGSLELSDLTLDSSDDISLEDMGGVDTAEMMASKDHASGKDGSLELGDLAIDSSSEEEESLDLSDLLLEEDEDSMDAETMSPGVITDDKDKLDLGDLALEGSEEDSFDLANFSLDDKETGELRLSDFQENKSKKGAAFSETAALDDDDLIIDLENLDLDLELDDAEDEK